MHSLTRPIVCVVIPTLNESGTIGTIIESLERLRALYNIRIIVVDDGSTDGTIKIVKESSERHGNLTLIERDQKLGLGSALIGGFRVALDQEPVPNFVVTLDADLSHDPSELPSLVEACKEDSLVVGSRYVEGGEVRGWSFYRKTLSRGANFIAKIFTNVPSIDCTSGFRCYGADLVRDVLPNLDSVGFDIQIEVLSKAAYRGFKIVEKPITFRERTKGKSKLSLRGIYEFTRRLIQLSLKNNNV